MSKIVRVIPFDDYTLDIRLDNSHRIIYDMKPRLAGLRLEELADMEKFKSVRHKRTTKNRTKVIAFAASMALFYMTVLLQPFYLKPKVAFILPG